MPGQVGTAGRAGARAFRALAGLLLLSLYASAAAREPPDARGSSADPFEPSSARFRHIDSSHGLSQDSVLSLAQDRDGVIWLGTQDGLNRHDGYDITVYRPQRGDAGTLSSPWIGVLVVDADGRLWVGTPTGLNRYDAERDRFTRFRHAAGDPASIAGDTIYAMHVDAAGVLWIGSDGGLSRWQPATPGFDSFRLPGRRGAAGADGQPPRDQRVRAISDAGDGRLWVGTDHGLLRFDPPTGAFEAPVGSERIDVAIAALLHDRRGRLWIATERSGLWRFDAAAAGEAAWSHWRARPDDPRALGHDQLRALLEDADGRVWVGTEAGVDRVVEGAETVHFVRYTHQRHDPHGLGKGAVAAMLADRDGTLWFGAWEGGASLLSRQHNQIVSFGPDMPAMRGLRSPSVRALAAAGERWWLGTEDGVYRFDPARMRLQSFDSTRGLYVFSLQVDGDALWLGTSQGLRLLDSRSGELQAPALPDAFTGGRVRRVLRDGALSWIGVQPQGLYVVDAASHEIALFHPFAGLVLMIVPFDAQTMLVGTQDGLYWFSRDGRRLLHRHPIDAGGAAGERGLPAAPVAFLRSRRGDLWLGTSGGGLVRLRLDDATRPDSARFDSIDRRSGLAADLIGAIVEDGRGRLWFSTTVGITRFDPADGTVRNYDRIDGVLDRSYWIGAAARLASGEVAFGGFDGFTVFDPDAITAQPTPWPPRLTALQIGNRQVGLRDVDPTSPLTQPLATMPRLSLPATAARSLGLRFSSAEFVAPEHLRFRYRLDGFDADWIDSAPVQRLATYTNLPPGSYTFRVQASNLDGGTASAETRLDIVIAPFWWQTGWAQWAAVAAFAGLLWGLLHWRLRWHRHQQQRLQREVSERTADIVRLGEIGKELTATLDLERAMDRVYRQVSARVDAHVFAICSVDAERDRLCLIYIVESGQRGDTLEFDLADRARPAVWCVRERRELVTGTQSQLLDFVQANLPAARGDETESIVYLPLVIGERVIGCLTVQSLRQHAYGPDALEFLRALASYTAIALDNASSYGRLDQAVAERTADILALGAIGRELTATLDAERAMSRVHERVAAMLDAHVFSIGLYDADAGRIERVYAVEGGRRSEAAEYSMDETGRPAVWCVGHDRELVVQSAEELVRYVGSVLPPKVGAATESVVYLPLRCDNQVRGYMSVQSLQRNAYSESQLEFLRVLASYTAIALENARSFARLDQAVSERTAELSTTLAELRATQGTLVEREKMASLGGLVAGVAHEVNTPLGIALTSASHLNDLTRRLFDDIDAGKLTRRRLAEFQAASQEGLRLVLGSLERANLLITSFKQVAVDQSSEQRREFDLRTVLDEILFSLRPLWRRAGHRVDLECDELIMLDSYPGALFQIITNLINNAVLHAFPGDRRGCMTLRVVAGDPLQLHFRDDGVGMPADVAAHAFEPFFTTRRGSGGSGLGLHLVYNLSTRLLGGSITLRSAPGGGTEFVLHIPRRAPATPKAAADAIVTAASDAASVAGVD